VVRITDALQLYIQSGENSKTTDETLRLRHENKLKDAKEVVAVLEAKSAAVRALLESRKARKKPPPVVAAAVDVVQPPLAKKRKTSKTPLKSPPVDPLSYIGKRVANLFPLDGVDEVFFGSITEFAAAESVVDKVDLWTVVYDDNDTEDLEKSELRKCLALYEKNKHSDTKRI
jgi:hypothetical protein